MGVRPLADLSVEVGHIYLRDLINENRVGETLLRRARAASSWVIPIIDYERRQGREVSTCILIDDYFWRPSSGLTPESVGRELASAFGEVGIPIDFIVFESALVESVDLMLRRLVPRPLPGAGTRADPSLLDADRPQFVTNGVPAFLGTRDRDTGSSWLNPDNDPTGAPDVFGVSGHHRIALEVELYDDSDRPWACPTLAAWWQLLRLGMLRFERGVETPPGTIQLNESSSLLARRCLTVLAPEFIEIEHAVRTILDQVHVDPDFLSTLSDDTANLDQGLSASLATLVVGSLADISYLFVEDDAPLH